MDRLCTYFIPRTGYLQYASAIAPRTPRLRAPAEAPAEADTKITMRITNGMVQVSSKDQRGGGSAELPIPGMGPGIAMAGGRVKKFGKISRKMLFLFY